MIVIEKIKYKKDYINSYGKGENISVHPFYKIKLQGKVSEGNRLKAQLQQFCEKEGCKYEWISDVELELNKEISIIEQTILDGFEKTAKSGKVCTNLQEKAIDGIFRIRDVTRHYDESFVLGCISFDSYTSEEYDCFCNMLAVFLKGKGYEQVSRDSREERWEEKILNKLK